MHAQFIAFIGCLAIVPAGCSKSKTTAAPTGSPEAKAQSAARSIDACALLTSQELQSVQGETLKATTPDQKSSGGFTVSQCYFALPTTSNSIVVTVTQKGDGSGARDPKQFWKETFHSEKGKDKATGVEEEEKGPPPEKVAGVGDEAFWTGNRFGGALYVLKGNAYIKIGIGSSGDQAAKLNKSKALAEMILKRL
jgi:hypothetical protein